MSRYNESDMKKTAFFEREKNNGRGEKRKKARLIAAFFAIFGLGIVLAGGLFLTVIARGLPSPDNFDIKTIPQSTKIYDRTGEILLYEVYGEEKRTVVPFEEMPDVMKHATIAVEDSDFYTQPAFDVKSIIRAVFVNLKEGRKAQGGSTITQQLAKNIFLTPEKTFVRKLRELVLAVQLESKYSKDEILYFYLNQIPYGSNAYGVEAASQTFFGKSVRELSLSEAALIASLSQAPSYYSPYGYHVDELMQRKDYVLDQMEKSNYISAHERDEAKKKEVVFIPESIGSIKAPHFSLMVREYLIEKYGEEALRKNGYRVVTTLDWKLQEIAEKVVKEGAAKNEKNYKSRNAALAAEDPKTGQLLVLVGSKDYFAEDIKGNFNVITQGLRQPGSTLKPFVYLTAFGRGYSPETVLFDAKTQFDTRGGSADYSPENYDGTFHGPIKMKQALAWSQNIPAVKTLYLAGMNDALENLSKFGITTLTDKNRYGLTLVLGGGEVRPIELLKAYSALSQDGVRREQSFVLKIEDSDGKMIEEWKQEEGEQVVDANLARAVNGILSDTELRSGLLQSSLPLTIFPGYQVALKTGTTQDYRDAWTFGYTPFLAVGVWAGNTENTQMVRQGSSVVAAIPMWSNFMREAIKNYEPEPFAPAAELPKSEKTMLNGEYISMESGRPEAHSILYYVDKSDPLGPPPQNPAADPQFSNWELGVSAWISEHNPSLQGGAASSSLFRSGVPVVPPGTPVPQGDAIVFGEVSPKNGEVKSPGFTISATIASGADLRQIELHQNGKLKNSIAVSGKTFNYQYYFYDQLEVSNTFEIKVVNSAGKTQTASFIVYKR